MGKSLIESYEWGKEQDWVGAILAPSCVEWLENNKFLEGLLKSKLILKWRVPLKSKEYKEYYVVNWPASVELSHEQKNQLVDRTIEAFQENNYEKTWAVQNKMEETIEFIKHSLEIK